MNCSPSIVTQNLTHRLLHPYTGQLNQGWSAPPEQITFVVTDACNFRCKMCQFAHSDAPDYQLNQLGSLPSQLFHKIMDEIPGYPIVTFTGGEPLLHPDIADFVTYAKLKKRFTTLTTNAWLLEKRAGELCQAGLDLLVVSVDGPREVHNRVRGGMAFERLTARLAAVMAQPRRLITFMSMAISDLNHDQLLPMFELARSWGVDGINYNHLWMQTHGMLTAQSASFLIFAADEVAWDIHPEKVDTQAVVGALDEIRRRTHFSSPIVIQTPDLSRSDVAVWYRQPERFVKYNSTRCAWTRLKVWPDGEVKSCREWGAGNVARSHAMQVWNGAPFREFRRLLAAHGTLPICARCCYMAHR